MLAFFILSVALIIHAMATLLVTVGSTSFPALTDFLTSDKVQDELHQIGVHRAIIQYGTHKPSTPNSTTTTTISTPIETTHVKVVKPELTMFDYAQSLSAHMAAASVVVSHAGAGTILEAIDLGKPLVVVINSALMDDHQTELARAMALRGCCRVVRHADITTQLLPAIGAAINDPQLQRANPPRRAKGVFAMVVAQELAVARGNAESFSARSNR